MNKKLKVILSVILAAFIVIPVFAQKKSIDDIKIGNVLIPGDEVQDSTNFYLSHIRYCDTNGQNCYDSSILYGSNTSTGRKKNIVWELNNYNDLSTVKLDEKNANGNSFVGWETVEIYNTSSTSDEFKGIKVIPKYGVQHKIIKQPTCKNPTVEVTEEAEVKKYTWYTKEKNSEIISKSEYSNGTKVEHDKDTNSYYLNKSYERVSFNSKIDIKENSKIIVTCDNPSDYNSCVEFSFSQSDESGTGSSQIYQINSQSAICELDENGNNICTQIIDLKDIKNGIYDLKIKFDTTSGSNSKSKVTFENSEVYTDTNKEVSNENAKKFQNREEGKEYFGKILYDDGIELTSTSFKCKKKTPKTVEDKIIDVVSNPLTGDNIIYTIIIGIVSLIMIVTLTKKTRNN